MDKAEELRISIFLDKYKDAFQMKWNDYVAGRITATEWAAFVDYIYMASFWEYHEKYEPDFVREVKNGMKKIIDELNGEDEELK